TRDDPAAIYRYGRLDAMPPRLSFARYSIPEPFAYCQPAVVDRAETLPGWAAELPADSPLVLAALGGLVASIGKQISPDIRATMHRAAARFDPLGALPAIVDGLSRLDCQAV